MMMQMTHSNVGSFDPECGKESNPAFTSRGYERGGRVLKMGAVKVQSPGRKRRGMWLPVVLGAFASVCGGDKASPPVTPSAALPRVPGALVLLSGETGQPAGGAAVVIAGQSLRADAGGQVTVPGGAAPGAFMDLVAPGFLDRQTSLREGSGSPRLSLWPRVSPTGLDENFTATLVYTSTADGAPVGGQSLRRIQTGVTAAYIQLSANLLGDAESVAWHQLAADSINVATGGRVIYQLSSNPPPGSVIFNVSYDPGNAGCGDRVRGFSSSRVSGGEITGGAIVYCASDAPRSGTVVHELGHSFGLFHSPNRSDVMYFSFVSGRSDVYTPREALAMRLMMDRTAGTRFPDNDRETSGATSQDGIHVIRCAG